MESEYGKYRSRINLSTFADPNAEEFDKFKELLEKNYGATFSVNDNNSVVATLSGNADEVYNKLLEIQNLADTFHFNDAFNNSSSSGSGSSGGSGSGGGVGGLSDEPKSSKKYLWDKNDDTMVGMVTARITELTKKMETDSSAALKNTRDNLQNFVDWYSKLGVGNHTVTDEIVQGIDDALDKLRNSDKSYLDGIDITIGTMNNRLGLASQYVETTDGLVNASAQNLDVFNNKMVEAAKSSELIPVAAEETIDAGKQQVEESSKKLLDYAQNAGLVKEGAKSLGDVAKTALTDADTTIEKATTDITTLNEAMGNLEIAKQGIQNAANNSVQGIDAIVTDTSSV